MLQPPFQIDCGAVAGCKGREGEVRYPKNIYNNKKDKSPLQFEMAAKLYI